ncbi:hypothetical protein NDU88_002549 [Pleurodeles waltl]|uniref:L1 transposable element RRM domain-containing protein n=1 Tax=Pleurodeles waltl TaxID=8319 RepID=A0AAV7UDH2_PLEWA|nr:hypothetical protein NDU88_002549 [Pleurodeles waltl]
MFLASQGSMVDKAEGVALSRARRGEGKIGVRGGRGGVAYSLRNAKAAKKRIEEEAGENSQKQTTGRSKEEQISNTCKRKGALSNLGSATNRKIRVTPSLRTYFRVLLRLPKMSIVQGAEVVPPLPGSGDITIPTVNGDSMQHSIPGIHFREVGSAGGGHGVSQVDTQAGGELDPLNGGEGVNLPSDSITDMLKALAMELKDGFKTSKTNQEEIRNLCEDLGKKIDDLAGRTAALEEEVGDLRVTVEENKEQIRGLKSGEAGVLAKLESLENNQRRNNLRFLRLPEGLEGDDLEGFVVKLIRQEIQFEDAEVNIAKDIQRVHRVPAKMPPNRDRPRKILVYFLTHGFKERILEMALKKKSLSVNGAPFEVRSDLASITLNKQWELGERIDILRRLGATAQLRFLASLRVMANNKMYNFSDCNDVDDLIKKLEQDSGAVEASSANNGPQRISRDSSKLLFYMMLVARREICKKWIDASSLTFTDWKDALMYNLKLDTSKNSKKK